MEAVANRFDTIDLTNEVATHDNLEDPEEDMEEDDIVYVGTRRAISPLLLPRPPDAIQFPPVQYIRATPRRPEEPIIIESDDEDDDLPPFPPSRPRPAFRIFSPPADFIPEQTRDAAAVRPPIHRIGLGGGMMAIRNREPEARYHSQDAARRGQGDTGPVRVVHRGAGWGRAFDVFAQLFNDRRDDPAARNARLDALDDVGPFDDRPVLPPLDRNRFSPGGHFAPNPAQALDPYLFRPEPEEPADPPYDWKWTHPKAGPRPGFTFDFDTSATSASAPIVIDDDTQPASSSSAGAGPSTTSSSTSATLICARCNSGLVIGGRTMWGLRCGHVICGPCADEVGRPLEGKGKGKELAEDEKGRGNVKEEPEAEEHVIVERRPVKGHPRRTSVAVGPSSTRQLRATTSQATAKSKDAAPSRKRYRSPAKRKVIQPPEEHQYFCPVAGCHRPHWSIKEYKGDEETPWKSKDGVGAIPIFT